MNSVHVFELRRRWVPELARQFHGAEVRVRGFESLADLAGSAVKAPADVAVLDLDAAPADCLRWLSLRINGSHHSATVVIGSQRTAELEPLVRELGAAAFVLDTIGGESLADVCRRQWTTQNRQPQRHNDGRRDDQ